MKTFAVGTKLRLIKSLLAVDEATEESGAGWVPADDPSRVVGSLATIVTGDDRYASEVEDDETYAIAFDDTDGDAFGLYETDLTQVFELV